MKKKYGYRSTKDKSATSLEEIELLVDDEESMPSEVEVFLKRSEERIQLYWDQWNERPIEQYVACDFRYVWGALQSMLRQDTATATGKSFVEWGSGFGIVTALAWYSGLSAVGIEAEQFLVEEGRKLLKNHAIQAELWHGNFLPSGAEKLAGLQSDHPSLFHHVPSAYSLHDCNLDDFAIVFAYPWPGEEHFQREVFCRYASKDALLLMFRGPYQIELYRKQLLLS